MMAFAPGQDAFSRASTLATSRFSVSGSISAKTGLAPARRIELAVAKKLNGVVMTASPGPIPAATSASQSPSVRGTAHSFARRAQRGEFALEGDHLFAQNVTLG